MENKTCMLHMYYGNTVKPQFYRQPSKDIPLKRTADFLSKAIISVEMNRSNKDIPLKRTKFSSPISVLIKVVSL